MPEPAIAVDRLQWLADSGIDTVIGRVPGIEQRTPLGLLARHVVPVAAEMTSRQEKV
jgi:hypothetical protein